MQSVVLFADVTTLYAFIKMPLKKFMFGKKQPNITLVVSVFIICF